MKKNSVAKPKTYIAVVLDESGSMDGIRREVVKAFNDAVETIQNKAEGQEVSVSLTTFSNNDHMVFFNAGLETLKPLTLDDYEPDGLTALWDGVGSTIKALKGLPDSNAEHVSFLVIVITDGQENNSRDFSANQIVELLKQTQSTDHWSFAFQVPFGMKDNLVNRFGLPSDNVFQWEATQDGIQQSSTANKVGLSNYFTARSTGVRSVKTFYEVTTDLSKVKEKDLKRLRDLQKNFKTFTVASECEMKEFIEEKTKSPYIIGSSYYQLMKPEKVQQSKNVLIMEKGKKSIYGGPEARDLVGLPTDGEAKVEPGNHSNFDIFVQSKSVNRKLPRGTKVLVDLTHKTNAQPTWDHLAVATPVSGKN